MVIDNIFKRLNITLSLTDEIQIFKWNQYGIIEKLAYLVEWKGLYGESSNLVIAVEEILKANYPTEYQRYLIAQEKFAHKIPYFSIEKVNSVGSIIDWLNGVYDRFGGLVEGLLGGLVVHPVPAGISISCEYDNGVLTRILNKGDGTETQMILNAFNLDSIPTNLTLSKNVTVRGQVTIKSDYAITQTISNPIQYINDNLFKEGGNPAHLVFIAYEWLANDKKYPNSTKELDNLREQGFSVPESFKADNLVNGLEKFEEYKTKSQAYLTEGCLFRVEKGDTIQQLYNMAVAEGATDSISRLELLFPIA